MNFLYSIFGLRKILLVVQNTFFNLVYRSCFRNRVAIFGLPIIVLAPKSCIENSRNLTLISSAYFSEPGINHPVLLRTTNPHARIIIGDNVGISGGGIVAAQEVILGNDVMLGANTFSTDTDFHTISPQGRRFNRSNVEAKPVTIEDNVFIGMNSIVLKGVTIGLNSVIGAGSIVTRNIPANSLAAGNPCKVIRQIQSITE